MSDTFTCIELYTQPDGTIECNYQTNDNNDDGESDGELTECHFTYPNKEAALKQWGKSHYGYFGQPVNVYLDGIKVA